MRNSTKKGAANQAASIGRESEKEKCAAATAPALTTKKQTQTRAIPAREHAATDAGLSRQTESGSVVTAGSITREAGPVAGGANPPATATAMPIAAIRNNILSPRDLLLPYQRKWADDDTRFKIGLMARQVGKDFSSGEEGIRDCYQAELRGDKTTWLIAAPSERQSLESLEKWKEWTEAYKLAIADIQEEREDPKNSESLIKSATITFPHGSRVIAVPGRPDTVRGFSANILATEFAFFEDPDKTWRALLPSITNPLRGGLKKCRLISTPNGLGNKFHDLWSKNYQAEGAKWSCHKVTITDAVAQGLPVDVEELRAALDDAEGWAQEYDPLDFLDTASVLLPYEMLALIENPLATDTAPFGFWETNHFADPLYLGIDFGRTKDLTLSWTLQTLGGLFKMTKEVLPLVRMSTPDQIDILRPRIRAARRVAFDYTGPGVGMGDYLVKEFGEWKPEEHKFGKIELCVFTNKLKVDIFPKLRMEAERRTLGIPVSRVIREDLHSMNRVALAGGGITYKAPHTADGHADRCTGLALAVHAASTGSGGGITTVEGIHTGGNAGMGLRRIFQPMRLRR